MLRHAPQISYDHGVSDKKLIGATIGMFFDRQVERYRDREALVVRTRTCAGAGASSAAGSTIWPPG